LHLIDVQSIASRNSIDPREGPSTVQRIVSLRRALMELIETTSDLKINGLIPAHGRASALSTKAATTGRKDTSGSKG
jgi:hypothetical protein